MWVNFWFGPIMKALLQWALKRLYQVSNGARHNLLVVSPWLYGNHLLRLLDFSRISLYGFSYYSSHSYPFLVQPTYQTSCIGAKHTGKESLSILLKLMWCLLTDHSRLKISFPLSGYLGEHIRVNFESFKKWKKMKQPKKTYFLISPTTNLLLAFRILGRAWVSNSFTSEMKEN